MIEQLRQIAIFAKTVDHGSFRRAARELRLSPSVVSHHISQLEETLNVALLYRSTRKLALTPEGQRLLLAAQQMLSAVDGALADISKSASEPTGELRITLPSVLTQSRLTTSLGEFSKTYTGIKLNLNYSDSRKELIDDGYDVAIRMGVKNKLSVSTRRLFQVKRSLIASKEYLALKAKPEKPEDVADWEWLELSPVHHIKPTFHKKGEKTVALKVTPCISANDARALVGLVGAGSGVAVIPEILAEEEMASGNIEVVLSDWDLPAVDVVAEWPTNAPRKGLIQLLVDYLTNHLAA